MEEAIGRRTESDLHPLWLMAGVLVLILMASDMTGLLLPAETEKVLVIITIDVEALPHRAAADHVDRLIFGSSNGGRAGIIEMMDIADQAGVVLSFFVDVVEEVLYPGEIIALMRLIHSRGHDVQLHAHPTLLSTEDWSNLSIEKEGRMHCWNERTADAMLDWMLSLFDEAEIPRPVAFRGGSFVYNAAILNSMAERGIMTSYNHNPVQRPGDPTQPYQNNSTGHHWSNGVSEVPVTWLRGERFDEAHFGVPHMAELFASRGSGAHDPAVMIMHSWTLLEKDEQGYFEYVDASKTAAFKNFLKNLANDHDVISASQLHQRFQSEELQYQVSVPIEEAQVVCEG